MAPAPTSRPIAIDRHRVPRRAPCTRPFDGRWGAVAVVLVALAGLAPRAEAASARLDLDVDPEEARVYLDGAYRGIADDLDDSPDYLWVSPGRHTLELRHDEYHTLRIYFEVASGERRRFDDELEETDGRPRRVIESNRLPATPAPPRAAPSPSPAPEPDAAVAFLRFLVEPGDAAVWLDGLFFGPADRFDGNPEMARVAPGKHTIELTRPGYAGQVLEVDLRREEERTLRVTLERRAE